MAVEPSDPQDPGNPLIEIFREFTFEAAHRLPNVPEGHKCQRLHGHSYRVTVHVSGPVDPATGMVMDFADIKPPFRPRRAHLARYYLSAVPGLENPPARTSLAGSGSA